MEIEFDAGEEGGWTELSMGLNARTKLEVFAAEPEKIRIALSSQSSHGEMGLGVGLTPDQAHAVADELNELAREVEEDCEKRSE